MLLRDSSEDIVQQFISIGKRIVAHQLNSGLDGNISVRSTRGMFITASGVDKEFISADDVIKISFDGTLLNGNKKPSTEFKLHSAIYNNRPDINAIIHTHPRYTTAFAAAGKTISTNCFPEVFLSLGKVPICPYATPSTDEVPESIVPNLNGTMALILANHGAVALGKSLDDAFYKMLKLEHTASIQIAAQAIGGVKEISEEKLKKLLKIAPQAYGYKEIPQSE
mgnify:FL=1